MVKLIALGIWSLCVGRQYKRGGLLLRTSVEMLLQKTDRSNNSITWWNALVLVLCLICLSKSSRSHLRVFFELVKRPDVLSVSWRSLELLTSILSWSIFSEMKSHNLSTFEEVIVYLLNITMQDQKPDWLYSLRLDHIIWCFDIVNKVYSI
jgi:hypothetical protein